MTLNTWGATPEDWETLSTLLGLTQDLLPVVSNPKAVISPESKMKDLGKTPSKYNPRGFVSGISMWTSKRATPEEIEEWSREPDYGICIQTRQVRALDLDITDQALASQIAKVISKHLGELPERFRANSSKSLFAIRMPGNFTKRVLKTEQGIVEFLATGQQFIACGTHPSGARYEWSDGGPFKIPEVEPTKFEALWAELESTFAVTPTKTSSVSVKAEKLAATSANDPVAVFLHDNNFVLEEDRATGRLDIVCPFVDEHSGDGAVSATSYFPAMTGGYALGHFDCKHAHCEDRTDEEFKEKLGIPSAGLNDFENLAVEKVTTDDFEAVDDEKPQPNKAEVKAMFTAVRADEFAKRPSPGWIVKNLLPNAVIVVLFGQTGSGKSFAVLDISRAIATASSWREQKVRGGRVIYVAAEGAGGFRNRLVALAEHTAADLSALDLSIINAAPNMMDKAQALEIAKAVLAAGGASVVVIDTFAQVMPGGNENSGEDVGKVLAHCQGIHRATGALVLLVHHSGKDEAKGARGHSSLKGNADAELEVFRVDNERVLSVSKQKDGEDGKEYGFRLAQIGIGCDKDGDEVTSCIVVESNTVAKKQKPRKGASVVAPAEGGEALGAVGSGEL